MMSQTATSQKCSRDIQTKETLVPRWILEHHFLHFPANDSISTSLASHSAQLSFFKCVPSSYRDGLFGSFQILPCVYVGTCNRAFKKFNTHIYVYIGRYTLYCLVYAETGIFLKNHSNMTGFSYRRDRCKWYKAPLRLIFLLLLLHHPSFCTASLFAVTAAAGLSRPWIYRLLLVDTKGSCDAANCSHRMHLFPINV